MTWPYFKDLFISRYECAETVAAAVIDINNDRPKDGESLAAYATRLIAKLSAKWKHLSPEEITVSNPSHASDVARKVTSPCSAADLERAQPQALTEPAVPARAPPRSNVWTAVTFTASLDSYNNPVLRDDCKKYDVMIGRAILTLGYTGHLTESTLRISTVQNVGCCDLPPLFDFYNVVSDISNENKHRLTSLLNEYSHAFIDGLPLTRVTTGELNIRLVDPARTIQRRPHRLSFNEQQIVREKDSELLSANIIRPSNSPFASQIFLVYKKDGDVRMCIDCRELNRDTVPDRFPLPLIGDQIARLSGANYYTCLDCANVQVVSEMGVLKCVGKVVAGCFGRCTVGYQLHSEQCYEIKPLRAFDRKSC